MEDDQYLTQQANRCYEIGRTCMDLDAAGKINRLGDEFRSKAGERRAAEPRNSRFPPRRNDRNFSASDAPYPKPEAASVGGLAYDRQHWPVLTHSGRF